MTDTLSFADRARARAAGAAAFANVLRKASVQREIDDAIRFANFGYDPDVEFVWKIVEPRIIVMKTRQVGMSERQADFIMRREAAGQREIVLP